jgi:hypothetical protein
MSRPPHSPPIAAPICVRRSPTPVVARPACVYRVPVATLSATEGRENEQEEEEED